MSSRTSATPSASTTLQLKVVAAETLPSGCKKAGIPLRDIPLQFQLPSSQADKEEIQIHSVKGRLKSVTSTWPQFMALAPDCHAANVVLALEENNAISATVVRTIDKNQELLGWFNEELLNALAIPHLSLNNFLGVEGRYLCDKCSQTFSDPNPLKIHLALDCGKMSRHEMFARILPSSPNSPPTSSTARFQPIFNADALRRLETSSGAQKKPGHLCLYCGKWYSRKYGLKIHIRTHTGFKPLQCKICLRPFGDPSNLNKHVRLHGQVESPYKCHHCGKILVRRRDLQSHLSSRHGIHRHRNSSPNAEEIEAETFSSEETTSTPETSSPSPSTRSAIEVPSSTPFPPYAPSPFQVFNDPASSAFRPLQSHASFFPTPPPPRLLFPFAFKPHPALTAFIPGAIFLFSIVLAVSCAQSDERYRVLRSRVNLVPRRVTSTIQGRGISFITRPSQITTSTSSNVIVNPFTGIQSRPADQVSYYVIERPIPTNIVATDDGDFDALDARYNYQYQVNDDLTGDHKSVEEAFDKRQGRAEGSYTIYDLDGTVRRTDYYADDTGYHATVTITRPDGTQEVREFPEPAPQAPQSRRQARTQIVRTIGQPQLVRVIQRPRTSRLHAIHCRRRFASGPPYPPEAQISLPPPPRNLPPPPPPPPRVGGA
ncbi:unnamed protein product [Cyprideis torosa]|uniref:Uncharacterized protein n=1 Tax=Cyprideis torosa TaxID=163714 RepID=A0A7R8WJV4_9CRUS|nr:unnamed protein product [Cyprideis torosa]CAG0895392.1 unnamed protein product [Cyprideis torosa]